MTEPDQRWIVILLLLALAASWILLAVSAR